MFEKGFNLSGISEEQPAVGGEGGSAQALGDLPSGRRYFIGLTVCAEGGFSAEGAGRRSAGRRREALPPTGLCFSNVGRRPGVQFGVSPGRLQCSREFELAEGRFVCVAARRESLPAWPAPPYGAIPSTDDAARESQQRSKMHLVAQSRRPLRSRLVHLSVFAVLLGLARNFWLEAKASDSAGQSIDSSGGGTSVVEAPAELGPNSQNSFSESLGSEEGDEDLSNENTSSPDYAVPAPRNLPAYSGEEEASISGEGFLLPLLTPQVGLWALVLAVVLLVMRGSSRTSEKQEAIRIHTSELRTIRSQLDELTKAVGVAADEAEKNLALLQVQRPRTQQSTSRLEEVVRQIHEAAVCVAQDDAAEKGAGDGQGPDSQRSIALPSVGFGWGVNEHKLIKAQASSGNIELQEVELRELVRAAVARIDQRDTAPATGLLDESSASLRIKQQNDEWLLKYSAALYPTVDSSFAPSYSPAQKQGSRESLHMLVAAGLMIEYRIELQEQCDAARQDVAALQQNLQALRELLETEVRSLLDDTSAENKKASVAAARIERLTGIRDSEREIISQELKPLQLTESLQELAANLKSESQDVLKKMQRDAAAEIASSSEKLQRVLHSLEERGSEAEEAAAALTEAIESISLVQKNQYTRVARLGVQFTHFNSISEAMVSDIAAADARGAALRKELAAVDEWLEAIKALLAKSAKA